MLSSHFSSDPRRGVRSAAAAGSFYPADPGALARMVDALIGRAGARGSHQPTPAAPPLALIAPHAGYVYSGAVAASIYAELRQHAARIHRVVLLGPSHFASVNGAALPEVGAFATPLGNVDVDRPAVARIEKLRGVLYDERAHAREHSIEVQLPFLQRILGRFAIVPIALGAVAADDVADLIELLLGEQSLIVVSSDLSHYLPYEQARSVDAETAARILALEPTLDHAAACGASAINGLLVAARRCGLAPRLVDLRNSGDTAGGREEVVGYGAFAFAAGSGA